MSKEGKKSDAGEECPQESTARLEALGWEGEGESGQGRRSSNEGLELMPPGWSLGRSSRELLGGRKAVADGAGN